MPYSPQESTNVEHYLQYVDEVIKVRYKPTCQKRPEWHYMFCAYLDFCVASGELTALICYQFDEIEYINIKNKIVFSVATLRNLEIQIVNIPNN